MAGTSPESTVFHALTLPEKKFGGDGQLGPKTSALAGWVSSVFTHFWTYFTPF